MKTRMYDAEIGRFLSVDQNISGNDALSLNPYLYCANNPIDRIDPSGKNWFSSLKQFVYHAIDRVAQSANQIIDWAAARNIPVISHIAKGIQWATSGSKWRASAVGIGYGVVAGLVGAVIIGGMAAAPAMVEAATAAYSFVVSQGKSIAQLVTSTISNVQKYELYGERLDHVIERHAYGTSANASKFPEGWDVQKIKEVSETVANNRALQQLPNTFDRGGFIRVGQYGDIVIKTVIQQGRIWTSYPPKLP